MDVNGNKEVFMYRKKKGQAYYTNRHSCFLLQYHMVFVTKYRRPVLTGEVKDLVYRIIRQVCEEKGLVVLELNGEPDHVHLLFEADPFTAPGQLANILKTTFIAIGFCPCGTDISSMEYQSVTEVTSLFRRYNFP